MQDGPSQNGSARSGILQRLLEQARVQLIQTDGRNRLIHTPRDAKRSKSLKIVDARPDHVFQSLVSDGQSLTFLPLPEETSSRRISSRSISALQTELTPEALQKRILSLFRDSRTIEEEQGVNVLYLAIGFLRWFDNENSETKRESAPTKEKRPP
jgi:hypothetical protein